MPKCKEATKAIFPMKIDAGDKNYKYFLLLLPPFFIHSFTKLLALA
jgi:hypothetical protein